MHEDRKVVTLDDAVNVREVLEFPAMATGELEEIRAMFIPYLIVGGVLLFGSGVGAGVALANSGA